MTTETIDTNRREEGFDQSKKELVIPAIAEQRPFGIESESDTYFSHTLKDRSRFSQKETVYVIGAHPDDGEEFMGATIARFTNIGYPIIMLTLTDGRYGASPKVQRDRLNEHIQSRLEESIAAGEVLGIHKIINIGIEDFHVPSYDRALIDTITKIVRKEGAGVVFSHPDPYNPHTRDPHPDHQNTSLIVQQAVMKAGLHLYQPNGLPMPSVEADLYFWDPQNMQSMYGDTAPAEIIIDATELELLKQESLKKYPSQMGNIDTSWEYADHIERRVAEDKQRGGDFFQYAEGFTPFTVFKTRSLDEKLAHMLGEEHVIKLPQREAFHGPISIVRRNSFLVK